MWCHTKLVLSGVLTNTSGNDRGNFGLSLSHRNFSFFACHTLLRKGYHACFGSLYLLHLSSDEYQRDVRVNLFALYSQDKIHCQNQQQKSDILCFTLICISVHTSYHLQMIPIKFVSNVIVILITKSKNKNFLGFIWT